MTNFLIDLFQENRLNSITYAEPYAANEHYDVTI